MNCSEFISNFTDYRDGLLAPGEKERLEGHQEVCPTCRSYRRVLDKGVGMLKSRPPLPVPDDFHPRLQHRIFHLEDDILLDAGSRRSGVTMIAALGLSLLLAAAAWSPVLQRSREGIILPPVLVTRPAPSPPPAPPALGLSSSNFLAPSSLLGLGVAVPRRMHREPILDRSTALLLEYSPLYSHEPSVRLSRSALD